MSVRAGTNVGTRRAAEDPGGVADFSPGSTPVDPGGTINTPRTLKGCQNPVVASNHLALNVHIIFATKGRAPMIAETWRPDLHAYIGGSVRGLGAVPTIVGGVADHVHILAGLRGTHAVSDLVREVKKASAVWAKERCVGFQWQEGFGAFSVSPTDVAKVVAYIANQEEHHRVHSLSDELRAIMVEFGIEVDERFFE